MPRPIDRQKRETFIIAPESGASDNEPKNQGERFRVDSRSCADRSRRQPRSFEVGDWSGRGFVCHKALAHFMWGPLA